MQNKSPLRSRPTELTRTRFIKFKNLFPTILARATQNHSTPATGDLLPPLVLVVPLGRQTVHGVHLQVQHALQLRLLVLFAERGWQGAIDCTARKKKAISVHWSPESSDKSLTKSLHPQSDADGDGDADHGPADDVLPLPGRVLELGKGLAEGGAVQCLLLLNRQVLPVALLLLAQRQHLGRVLLEAHGRHRVVDAILVHGLAVPAVAHDLPATDLGPGSG